MDVLSRLAAAPKGHHLARGVGRANGSQRSGLKSSSALGEGTAEKGITRRYRRRRIKIK